MNRMAIPDYQAVMLPLLLYASDGEEHSTRETIDTLASHFKLTEEERKVLLDSGQQTVFDNRVGWASTYLRKAGLLERTRRGYFRITPRGRDLLKQKPSTLSVKVLEQFPEFLEFNEA